MASVGLKFVAYTLAVPPFTNGYSPFSFAVIEFTFNVKSVANISLMNVHEPCKEAPFNLEAPEVPKYKPSLDILTDNLSSPLTNTKLRLSIDFKVKVTSYESEI